MTVICIGRETIESLDSGEPVALGQGVMALPADSYDAPYKRIAFLEERLKRYDDLYAEAYGNDGWDDHMLAVAFEKIHLGEKL